MNIRQIQWATVAVALAGIVAACGGGSAGVQSQIEAPIAIGSAEVEPIVLTNGQAANVVIGQDGFQNGLANQGEPTAAFTLDAPRGISLAPGGRLFVADSSNYRVLGYVGIPAADNAAADIVVGQSNFEDVSALIENTVAPTHISFGHGKTFVTDSGHHRILIYTGIPVTGSVPAVVLGQGGVDTDGGPGCSATQLWHPFASFVTPNGKLIVSDRNNHRILIWHQVPTVSGAPANIVLGNPDMTTCIQNNDINSEPSARTLFFPEGIWSDGDRLAVADAVNNRVLIWDKFPEQDFAPAAIVLGQQSFTEQTPNDGNPSAQTLDFPRAVASNGVQFAVADSGNNRVLVWNAFPSSSGQAADVVLGHPGMENESLSAPSATTLRLPSGIAFGLSQLIVSDTGNNRVLVFRSK